MKIYRYLSAHWALKSLKEEMLKASDPRNFNDPFELSPNFDHSSFSRGYIRDLFLKEDMIEVCWERERGKSPALNYGSFRDLYLRTLDLRVDEHLEKVPGNIERGKATFLETAAKHWRILSFSKVYDSILMWSHYCEKHTGIILEFDTENDEISKVGDDCILEVEYVPEKPLFIPKKDQDDFNEVFRKIAKSKSQDWYYEQEIRLLVAEGALEEDDFFPFDQESVTGIYVGARTTEDDKSELLQILQDGDYKDSSIYFGETDKDFYCLNFSKLSL